MNLKKARKIRTTARLSKELEKIRKHISSILDYSPYNLCLGGEDANELEGIMWKIEIILANTMRKQLQ